MKPPGSYGAAKFPQPFQGCLLGMNRNMASAQDIAERRGGLTAEAAAHNVAGRSSAVPGPSRLTLAHAPAAAARRHSESAALAAKTGCSGLSPPRAGAPRAAPRA